MTILSNIIVKKFFRPIVRRFSSLKSPAVAAISHAFPRLRLPRKTSADAPPVRLSPARSAKKRNPYRIAFFSSGGMGFASNWTALRLPCRVFALQKSRSPLARPLRKKTQPLSDCVFFKWRDGLRVELDCAALALSGFCVAKIPFASRLSAPQKTQPYRIAFSSKWRDGRDSNSRPPA